MVTPKTWLCFRPRTCSFCCFNKSFPFYLRRIQECVLFSNCDSKQYCFEKYPENVKHTFWNMRFYKRNERKWTVCKKGFQSNIALTQLLFFVKTTCFHGSRAGVSIVLKVLQKIFSILRRTWVILFMKSKNQKLETPLRINGLNMFFSDTTWSFEYFPK